MRICRQITERTLFFIRLCVSMPFSDNDICMTLNDVSRWY